MFCTEFFGERETSWAGRNGIKSGLLTLSKEHPMYRMIVVGLLMSVTLGFSPSMVRAQSDVKSDPTGAKLDPKADTQTFLTIAAEEQQVAITLGQLAAQRAKNDRVKEFGSKMVEDHRKVRREAEEWASKHQVPVGMKLTPEDKQKVDELSQLSGHEFDRAYMNLALQNHETTLEQFQQHLETMRYPDLRVWFTSILPMLKAHRDQARLVKNSLQTNP
jgi:predicted outer membrane protein